MRRREWSVLIAMLAGVSAAGCGGDNRDAAINADTAAAEAPAAAPAPSAAATPGVLPPGVTADMVAQGGQIFNGAGNCFTCHGQDAKGTQLAPNLTDNQWLNSDGSFEAVVQTIANGVPQPKEHPAPMPAKGGSQISDEQVRAVAAYVYSLAAPQ